MKKIRRTDWQTSIDVRYLARRNAKAVDEAQGFVDRERRVRRARRSFLRRVPLRRVGTADRAEHREKATT